MRRHLFLAALLAAAVVRAQSPAQAPFALEEATSADLQQRMQSGRETARSLAEQYVARIEAVDRDGPALHSVLALNPDALAIADRLDAERKTRGPRGPLHGIPILLKDNIATPDRSRWPAPRRRKTPFSSSGCAKPEP
jgi:amidase